MNEQLIVKNFGPIKDATVDFKRVTVFIGPTGGGKSTLAKLRDILIYRRNYYPDDTISHHPRFDSLTAYKEHSISNYFSEKTYFLYNSLTAKVEYKLGIHHVGTKNTGVSPIYQFQESITSLLKRAKTTEDFEEIRQQLLNETSAMLNEFQRIDFGESTREKFPKLIAPNNTWYCPSERVFVSSLEYSWPGLLRDDISIPKSILDFANNFSISRQELSELNIPFLGVKYIHRNGQDFIKIPESETLFRLYETASGIQSVTPLLVLLEHLSRNTEQAQSFIIEEPELNLFPLAQFELVKILVEKCAQTKGKNDLVVTTHSPYVLTALNLLCYAYRIAQQDEATAKKVAKLIPRHCWIDPDQFAAYYVDRPDTKRKQQVRSIINKKTGLIEENELDTASDELGAIFDKLVRLRKPTPTPSRAK